MNQISKEVYLSNGEDKESIYKSSLLIKTSLFLDKLQWEFKEGSD